MPLKKDVGLIIPKTTSSIENFLKPLQALEDTVCTWVTAEDYFSRVQELEETEKNIMTLHHRTSYPVYFGLMECETIGKGMVGKQYKLNPKGLAFMTAYTKGTLTTCTDIIMEQLVEVNFGTNDMVSSGTSSVQPPVLAVKLARDKGYVNSKMLTFASDILEENIFFQYADVLSLVRTIYPNWIAPTEIKSPKVDPAKLLLNLMKNFGIFDEIGTDTFVLTEHVENAWGNYIDELYVRRYTDEEIAEAMYCV